MASRTQIICLCEGQAGASIDPLFINKLMKTLRPNWVRYEGSNVIRIQPCESRAELIKRTPEELRSCMSAGGHTTLMVWADCDDDCADGDALKDKFWKETKQAGITKDSFDRIVFIFAKDRLENWIEFLTTGVTNEAIEGPRIKHDKAVADAATKLAEFCKAGRLIPNMPSSLEWSCKNWKTLKDRMRT